jgi:hypothetical protein
MVFLELLFNCKEETKKVYYQISKHLAVRKMLGTMHQRIVGVYLVNPHKNCPFGAQM